MAKGKQDWDKRETERRREDEREARAAIVRGQHRYKSQQLQRDFYADEICFG